MGLFVSLVQRTIEFNEEHLNSSFWSEALDINKALLLSIYVSLEFLHRFNFLFLITALPY